MKIETKFDDGDTIFFLHQTKVIDSIVRGFKIECMNGKASITYLCNKDAAEKQIHIKVEEDNGFKTKKDLIDSL